MKSIFIGFDFSMNKPACTILYDKQFYHMIWPSKMQDKHVKMYQDANVFVRPRNLEPVSTKDKNSQIVLEHTRRSTELANMIIEDLDIFINEYTDPTCLIYISSEGLSYGSTGDAALNLATYKGVLLSKLYEHYQERLVGLYTYPPITMKSVAGCAKKGTLADKNKMITAFMKESVSNSFHSALIDGKLLNKTSYIQCVDDIVDSYWAVVTMIKKELVNNGH